MKGLIIRIKSAFRCLFYKQFIHVCWIKEKDDMLDFRISYKGIRITEVIHRLKVDVIDILEELNDQDSAIDEVNRLIK